MKRGSRGPGEVGAVVAETDVEPRFTGMIFLLRRVLAGTSDGRLRPVSLPDMEDRGRRPPRS